MEYLTKTYIASDNIISALGFTTKENMQAINEYRSGISMQTDGRISSSPILAATIDQRRLAAEVAKYNLMDYTPLEQILILSIQNTLSQSSIDLPKDDCGLIISTTKGNIDLIEKSEDEIDQKVYLWKMAERVGNYFGFKDVPTVISNACISGISALVVGKRFIENGTYKHVIVAGGDLLSHFITSGFLSFKSISERPCTPYDGARDGLNLGEAAGSVLLTSDVSRKRVCIAGGAISNDANHISGPSRTGDGLHLAIQGALKDAQLKAQDISFINAHGTATVYNDDMESKAIHLSRLQYVPVQSLKPYFGHTLGASGVIESIIGIHELTDGVFFGTKGFQKLEVSQPIVVNPEHQVLRGTTCLKTASGFGGCNAAIIFSLVEHCQSVECYSPIAHTQVSNTCIIEHNRIVLDGELVFSEEGDFATFIRKAYKNLDRANMKFSKMDNLYKLGYIAAEYLLQSFEYEPSELGLVLANSSASLDTDLKHQAIIDKMGDDLASPSVFVYTLPSVVMGEICIRHKIQGENTFFVSKEYDPVMLENYSQLIMQRGNLKACIFGWCELLKEDYRAEFKLIRKE